MGGRRRQTDKMEAQGDGSAGRPWQGAKQMRAFLKNSWVVVVLAVLALGVVQAQAPVTPRTSRRLETSAGRNRAAGGAASKHRSDARRSDRAPPSLELKEDITYLKVKQRRETGVTREEYATVRDRLETLRTKAAGRSEWQRSRCSMSPKRSCGRSPSAPSSTSVCKRRSIPARRKSNSGSRRRRSSITTSGIPW